MKNKPNPKDFVFSNKTGETLLRKPGDIRGYDFVIDTLKDCTIYLLDRSAQITVDMCSGCTFYIGPVEGSLFLRDCTDCKVSVCCQQLRTKNCHRLAFNVFCSSDPSIEYSDELQFGPYNFAYPKLDEQFSDANLQIEEDHWSQIFDFNQEEGARHWKLQDPAAFKLLDYPLEGLESPVNPVPRHQKYGGTIAGPIPLGSQQQLGAEDSGGMLAFGIDTPQAAAQNLYAQPVSQPPLSSDPFADFPASSQRSKPDLKTTDPFAESHDDLFAGPFAKPGAPPQDQIRQAPFSAAQPQDLSRQPPFSAAPAQDLTRQTPFSAAQPQDLTSGFQARQDPFSEPPAAQRDFFQEASEEPQQKYDAFQEDSEPIEEEEELDEDTKERLRARERAYQEHMKALYEKEETERSAKAERRAQASDELRRWKEERARQTDQRKQYNRQQEDSFLQARKAYKEGAPWKKVSSMIDYKESSDRKDLARMRQVLLAKKNE